MSEKHPQNHESHHEKPEAIDAKTHLDRLHAKTEKEATEAKRVSSSEQIENAQKKIEQHAQSIDKQRASTESENRDTKHNKIDIKNEQNVSFSRTMVRIRKKLNVAERPLSKLVHNSTVDKVSELTGKTIARPSGLLGGAFFAFIGTSALLWITRHYGYEYNYLVVLLTFAIGMTIGLGIEFILTKSKRILKK